MEHMPKIIVFIGVPAPEINTSTSGGRIKRYRYEHGLSLENMAMLIGIDPSTLTRVEADQYSAKSKSLQ